jgi:hypothetical protein
MARKAGATISLVTAEKDPEMANLANLTIVVPRLDEAFVYGGGDFELALPAGGAGIPAGNPTEAPSGRGGPASRINQACIMGKRRIPG